MNTTHAQEMIEINSRIDEHHQVMGELAVKMIVKHPEMSDKVLAILANVSKTMLTALSTALEELDGLIDERMAEVSAELNDVQAKLKEKGITVPDPQPVMYMKPGLPDLVFEEHRYTEVKDDPENKPDGWVFTRLNPEEYGGESPFGYNGLDQSRGWYARIVDGWMRNEPAEGYRRDLIKDGYRKVEWSEVPSEVIAYNESYVVPIEWQNDPDFCKEMSWVWIKGEWPL